MQDVDDECTPLSSYLFDCIVIICRVFCISYARCLGLQFHDIGDRVPVAIVVGSFSCTLSFSRGLFKVSIKASLVIISIDRCKTGFM